MQTGEVQARATRFAVATSVRFRQPGSADWREGWTVNISRTGVLFSVESPVPVATSEVEFILALSVFGPAPSVQVLCTGHVARMAREERAEGGSAIAATIEGYRFLREFGSQHPG